MNKTRMTVDPYDPSTFPKGGIDFNVADAAGEDMIPTLELPSCILAQEHCSAIAFRMPGLSAKSSSGTNE